jgi:anti-anti-sigma regulatory factor
VVARLSQTRRRQYINDVTGVKLLQSTPVTVTVEQVDLLSVAGQLDGQGLERLQSRVDELLDGGARLLIADLSGVAGCDGRLFVLLSQAGDLVGRRGGWLRLVGLRPPVLNALDQAALPDVLLVYRAAVWASRGSAEPPRPAVPHRHSAAVPASAQPAGLGSAP